MAFDLDQTNTVEQSEEGYEFELKMPDGKPTGAFLKVRGDYSPTVRNFVKKKISEYQIKAKVAERKGKDVETTPDDVEDENRLKGTITDDDAIDIVLPVAWKKRVPRMFGR